MNRLGLVLIFLIYLLSNLKKGNTDNHIVSVQFQEKVSEDLFHALEEISTVQNKDGLTFLFESKNPEALRKKILEISISHHLNIISLNSEKSNLEDVFKTLTQL